MRVLVTDDSVTVRMILKGLLKQLEITDVIEAANGSAALAALAANPVDLMLLDIHMPVMDGVACLHAIRTNPATEKLAVIIISSDTTPAQIDEVMKIGANSSIGKPFRIEGLRDAIAGAFPWLDFPATGRDAGPTGAP